MELLLNLGFVVIIICAIVFFAGVVKLFTNKDSNSKAIKMILFSLLTIVIILVIGVSVCFSNLQIGGMH
jgi:threonine/homoserine/homoserine lactone efflux protein